MKCPQCQSENKENAKFCKSCGFKLEGSNKPQVPSTAASSVCPNCGAEIKPNAKFCSKCGATVPAVVAPAPDPVPVTFPMPDPVPAVPEPENKTEVILSAPDEDRTEILLPEAGPVLAPAARNGGSPTVCPNCGAALKPNAKFCSKCGTTISSGPVPAPVSRSASGSRPASVSQSAPVSRPASVSQSASGNLSTEKQKKKAPVAAICIILVLLLLGGGVFALYKADVLKNLSFGKNKKEEPETVTVDATEDKEEDITAELEEKLTPIAEQAAAGEEKMSDGDYTGASIDFREALNAYAALASEYDSEDAIDIIDPSAADAFDLYTQSVLKQVEGWEAQSPTAPLYQQIDLTMVDAFNFADQLKEAGLTIDTDALDTDYAEFPSRYKEKYILAFNDLIDGDWSRTTAWNYMQDAASVGLVDKNDPDDPLTLRYAYAHAWITQKEISEGRNDGSVTDEEAISSILTVAKSADYNPALMRELALCYDAAGNTGNAKLIKDACVDIRNYLANTENVYIYAEELFVSGKSANASSTIHLTDFWYFSDFGKYSGNQVVKGGVSKEGRDYIRNRYKQAIDSLQ